MATIIGVLEAVLGLDSGQFVRGLRQAESATDRFDRGAKNLSRSMLSLAGVAGFGAVARGAIQAGAELDSLERGLRAVTGSAESTEQQLRVLADIAKLPGLGFKEAIQGATRLQAVGFSAEEAARYLKSFGNAIALVGGGRAELDRTTLALGQLAGMTQGFGQEIRQLIQASPAFAKAIRDVFGTMDPEVIAQKAGSGRNFVAMLAVELEKLGFVSSGAKTALENLSDASFKVRGTVGKELLEALEPTIKQLTEFADRLVEDQDALEGFATGVAGIIKTLGLLISPIAKAIEGYSLLIDIIDEFNRKQRNTGIDPTAAKAGAFGHGSSPTIPRRLSPFVEEGTHVALDPDQESARAAARAVEAAAAKRKAEQIAAMAAAAERAAEAERKYIQELNRRMQIIDVLIDLDRKTLKDKLDFIDSELKKTEEFTRAWVELQQERLNVVEEIADKEMEAAERVADAHRKRLEAQKRANDEMARAIQLVDGQFQTALNFKVKPAVQMTGGFGSSGLVDPISGDGKNFMSDIIASITKQFDFKQIASTAIGGLLSGGLSTVTGAITSFVDNLLNHGKRAREEAKRLLQAQTAWSNKLADLVSGPNGGFTAARSGIEAMVEEWRKMFTKVTEPFNLRTGWIRDENGMFGLQDVDSFDDLIQVLNQMRDSGRFTGAALDELNAIIGYTARLAKDAAEALARQGEQFGLGLDLRRAQLGGDDAEIIRARHAIQAANELQAAEDLLEAGAITQEMFDALAQILDDELSASLEAVAQAAADAAAALAEAQQSLIDSIALAQLEQDGDEAAIAEFRAQARAAEWLKEAERLGLGQDIIDSINEWLQTELDKIAESGKTEEVAQSAVTQANALDQEVRRMIGSMTTTQAVGMTDLLRSANIWLGEIAFNTRALKGDGVGTFPGTNFGRPGGGGDITIENLTVQAGVLVADERGIRELSYRMARHIDQALGSEITMRDRLSGNVNRR